MRTIVWLYVSLVILAAGCAEPSSTGGGSGTSRTTTGNQGIAVGEPHPGVPAQGAPIPPAHAENTTNGIHIVADQDVSGMPPGGRVNFTYTATNLGADAITWGGCYRAYGFSLQDESGKQLALEPNRPQCQGFTENPFPSGQKASFGYTWNGTYVEGEQYIQAPNGHYFLTATFTVYRAEQAQSVSVTLAVNILE